MTTRIHEPSRGWGTVSEIIKNSMHSLYPTSDHPTHLAFVRWERGGGAWVDPSQANLTWENINALEIPA